jgi:hypothetical protein
MTDDDVVSAGMAGLELARGIDSAVPVDVIPPVGVLHVLTDAAAHPIVVGSMAVGESHRAPSIVAAISSVAPTAREVIIFAGARIAASAARIPPGGDVLTHDGSAHMPARHSFNRNWLSLAITYSMDRKYDGLSLAPQSED